MGSGSGNPVYAAAVSGAGGGRILPGAASGTLSVNFNASNSPLLGPIYGLAGGGPGQAGTSGNSPGGGGWGASGGTAISGETIDTSDPAGTKVGPDGLGGAGGKAINTNGYAVTFSGGADRIYGVVG